MSFRLNNDWRGMRNNQFGSIPSNFGTMHYSVANYCTDNTENKNSEKTDLNEVLSSKSYLNKLNMLSNPLQKNLADTLHNIEAKETKNMTNTYEYIRQSSYEFVSQKTKEIPSVDEGSVYTSPLTGIGRFISNVFSAISHTMPFKSRPKSPSNVYTDLDQSCAPRDCSPPLVTWPRSNTDIQNKNKTQSQTHYHSIVINEEEIVEMNKECVKAANQCEGKLASVRMLLANKVSETKKVPSKPRRPRKLFVPPNSVHEDVFEDAFSPEDCERLANNTDLEHISTPETVDGQLIEINTPKLIVKTPLELVDIGKRLDAVEIKADNNCNCDEIVNKDISTEINNAKMVINKTGNPEILINDENITNKTLIDNKTLEIVKLDNDAISNVELENSEHKINCTINNPITINVNETAKPLLIDAKFISTDEVKELATKIVVNDNSADENINLKDAVNNNDISSISVNGVDVVDAKAEIVSSCEDKLSKLKALLSERKNNKTIHISNDQSNDLTNNNIETYPKRNKVRSKKHKNPNRSTDKRKKCYQFKDIQESMNFANEIESDLASSFEPSPTDGPTIKLSLHEKRLPTKPIQNTNLEQNTTDNNLKVIGSNENSAFDEISGRFRNLSTTDSEDSFQIVFSDNLQIPTRHRKSSDCDSEDSFIVFEDADSCYTSTDVFGDSDDTDNDSVDDSSEYSESDSGNDMCKLNNAFSRTVSDLTDDSLYLPGGFDRSNGVALSSGDEVDCAVKLGDELASDIVSVDEVDKVDEHVNHGVLLTDDKKLKRSLDPPKTVRFSDKPPVVHVMRVWQFAARQARAGHWERHSLDRERFQRRIADVDMAISWVLKPQHRSRVKFQRFMPWWNAQRRQEAAEKKLREEQERIKAEEERIKKEEEERIQKEKEEEQRRLEEIENQKKLDVLLELASKGFGKRKSIRELKKAKLQQSATVLVNGASVVPNNINEQS